MIIRIELLNNSRHSIKSFEQDCGKDFEEASDIYNIIIGVLQYKLKSGLDLSAVAQVEKAAEGFEDIRKDLHSITHLFRSKN